MRASRTVRKNGKAVPKQAPLAATGLSDTDRQFEKAGKAIIHGHRRALDSLAKK